MTTYNTGNPVPSADARDRYDNSQTLDEAVNGDSESYASRTGKQVISLGGMNSRFNNAQEARESEFNLSQEEKQEAFQSFLDGTGWSSIGAYGAGVVITSHTQTVDYQGQPYSLKPSIPASLDAPYVTTGTWATEGVNFKLVGDNSLRQNLADPTIGPGILGYKNPGLSGIAGSDETTVGVKIAESVSLYDFGAVGGSADDSTHCYDALTWLYGGSNRRLILPPGKEFRAPQKLEIQVGSGQNRNCHLSGYGASLLLEGTGGIQVYVNGTTLIRGLSVKGLRTVGGTTAFEFRAADSLNFIFDASIEDCDFSGYTESGLVLSGNVFESTLTKHSSSSLNSTGYGVHLRNQGTGIISSVDVFGGTTRGGKHGLFVESPVNDFRMFGGTYLMAKNEGVRIDNAVGAEVFGTHVEMNWSSAGSLAAGGAGLHMTGRGGIHGVFGANSPTTFQQYVVSVFANDITITGGGAVGTYTKYGKYQQPSGGSLTLVGETAASYDAAGEVFPAQVGKLIKSVHISKTENFRNYAAAVTVDLNRGNFFRVGTLTGNVSIGNPSNRLAVNGEELKVALTQDSVGARTVTWGSDFASGITPIDATPFKTSIWNFSWTGAKWRQESFAASL